MPIGSVASRGMSFAPGEPDNSALFSGIGKVIGQVGAGAFYDPTKDPDVSRNRLNNAQADKVEREVSGNQQVGDILAQVDASIDSIKDNPEQASQNLKSLARQAISAGAANGIDPKTVAQSFLSMSQMIPHSNSDSMDFHIAAGGGPVGTDQSFTEGRQDELIGRKEDLATSLNAADNATSRANTNAGITAENKRFYNPATVNAGPGDTVTMFDELGQPKRTLSGVPTETTAKGQVFQDVASGKSPVTPSISAAFKLAGSADKPPGLGFNTGGDIDNEIKAQIGDAGIDAQTQTAVRARASQLYQQNQLNPTDAVRQALQELTQTGTSGSDDWIPFNESPAVMPKQTMAAPQAKAPAQPGKGSGATAPTTVPPAGQRKAGQIYPTPKGPMIWTGTGWRPAPDA